MKVSHVAALALFLCLPLVAQEPADSSQAPPTVSAKRPNIPDQFTNLTLLPYYNHQTRTHGHYEAVRLTIKVRCSYCHTVSDDLSEGSFASDEKHPRIECLHLARLIFSSISV